MNINNLVPARTLAMKYGVKMISYGPPGSGKTPAVLTAPRPIILVCEPGTMTLRQSNVPSYAATTEAGLEEFFLWWFGSAETRNFDTIGIDSGSELAEIVLASKLARYSHGMKAYGEMSTTCNDWFTKLFYQQNKHVYIICKETFDEETTTTFDPRGVPQIAVSKKFGPYFPGKDLPMKVSHKYDVVARCVKGEVPGVQGRIPHFRCIETDKWKARDRSGNLSDYEPLDLSALFAKAMSK